MTEGDKDGIGYGKVMFCGGYCVLEDNPQCVMWSVENAKIVSKLGASASKILTVHSDFENKPLQYSSTGSKISGPKNNFIDTFFSIVPPEEGGNLFISTDELFGGDEAKTGLGSSSALIASLCNLYDIDPIIGKKIHYIASGNSGSGADIMSSFKGSMIYHSALSMEPLKQLPNPNWRFWLLNVPEMKGTNTRERIKIWKSIAIEHKSELKTANAELCMEWRSGNIRKSTVERYRNAQKQMSLFGLEIEPNEWSEILDVLNVTTNVVAAVCPGSGGFDSAVMITTGDVEVADNISIRELFLRF